MNDRQALEAIVLQLNSDDLIVARFSDMLPKNHMLIEATQAPLGLSAWPEFTRRTLGVLHWIDVGQMAYEIGLALTGPFEAEGTRVKFGKIMDLGIMMRAATDPGWDEVETIADVLDDLAYVANEPPMRPIITLELPEPASI